MKRKRIAIIAGNGLSLSLMEYGSDSMAQWNPSKPLSWKVPNPSIADALILEALPRFSKALHQAQKVRSDGTDFDHLEYIHSTTSGRDDDESLFLLTEARHYIGLAYSQFQIACDKINLTNWPWFEWLSQNISSIVFAVSFNYDLTVERLITSTGSALRGFGILGEHGGIPLLKPHGSIDFDTHPRVISLPTVTYPLQNWLVRNNCFLRRIPSHELDKSRVEVNIVLPGEASFVRNFQWVKPGFDRFRAFASTWSDVVIVGLRYWACDRPEIDFLLDSLSIGTRVHVVNPNPPAELIEAIKQRGLLLQLHADPTSIG